MNSLPLLVLAALAAGCAAATPASQWSVPFGAEGSGIVHMVNSAAISADGTRVLCATYYFDYPDKKPSPPGSFGVFCYDQTGHENWHATYPNDSGGFYCVALTPDGRTAAAGGRDSTGRTVVQIFDGSTGQAGTLCPAAGRPNELSFAADGSILAIADQGELAAFRRGAGGYFPIGTVPAHLFPGSADKPLPGMQSVAISADGRRVVSTDYNGSLYFCSTDRGSLVLDTRIDLPGDPQHPHAAAHCVRMTPDGATVVVGCAAGKVYLYSSANVSAAPLPAVALTATDPGPNHRPLGRMSSVAISDDGATVAAASMLGGSGVLSVFSHTSAPDWQSTQWPLALPPNGLSLSQSQRLVAVADGFEHGGDFELFSLDDPAGPKWIVTTNQMNWPISIAHDAAAIVAGSDAATAAGGGAVFYFRP